MTAPFSLDDSPTQWLLKTIVMLDDVLYTDSPGDRVFLTSGQAGALVMVCRAFSVYRYDGVFAYCCKRIQDLSAQFWLEDKRFDTSDPCFALDAGSIRALADALRFVVESIDAKAVADGGDS